MHQVIVKSRGPNEKKAGQCTLSVMWFARTFRIKRFRDVDEEKSKGCRELYQACAFRLSLCRYVGMSVISIADFGEEGAELQGP